MDIRKIIKEELENKSIDKDQYDKAYKGVGKDVSGKDNDDLCDELTVNSKKAILSKMRGMKISKKDKTKIDKLLKDMDKTNKSLDVDRDTTNTTLRFIQNMLCTYSQEDKENID